MTHDIVQCLHCIRFNVKIALMQPLHAYLFQVFCTTTKLWRWLVVLMRRNAGWRQGQGASER